MSTVRLKATVRAWGPDGAYVEIPGDTARRLGATDQLHLVARLNGVEIRKSLALRSGDVFRMALGKAVRAEANVRAGDEVTLELARGARESDRRR